MKDALGISGNEIARLVGCSSSAIQRLVRGEMKNFKNGAI
jgi:transcriptional regulator with XRE-family HTH domain